jgi:hypothetical protein
MASGRLRLQLLDFFLDQLGIFLELLRSLFAPLDLVRELFHPLLVQHDAQLVAGIPSPVEQLLRSLRLRQKQSSPRQR